MRRRAVTIAALLALGVFALSSEVRVANAALLNSGIAPSVMWPSAIAQVERDLGATEAAVRRKAAEALFDLPRSAQLRLLPHVLGDADNDIKLLGAALAREANLSQAPDLVPWLTDGDVRLRIAAIELYELLPDQRVISDLIRALGDSEASVRGRAVRALASLGSTEGVLPILGHIDDADAD
ncbi:MAG TPA: HEAT repeat domain-containing protein, partial [Polyangiaceae bacterium]|nr:HEAT repeat domain-containing protein [Polyangiaceae bacterium]